MSFLSTPNVSNDEYSIFRSMAFTDVDHEMVQFDGGIVSFWIRKLNNLPNLSEISIRIYLPPAPSTSIERNFSLLKKILRPERAMLKDDITQALLYVKDAFSPFEFSNVLDILSKKNDLC